MCNKKHIKPFQVPVLFLVDCSTLKNLLSEMQEEGEMGKQLKMRKLRYSSESHRCVWEWGCIFSVLGRQINSTPINTEFSEQQMICHSLLSPQALFPCFSDPHPDGCFLIPRGATLILSLSSADSTWEQPPERRPSPPPPLPALPEASLLTCLVFK